MYNPLISQNLDTKPLYTCSFTEKQPKKQHTDSFKRSTAFIWICVIVLIVLYHVVDKSYQETMFRWATVIIALCFVALNIPDFLDMAKNEKIPEESNGIVLKFFQDYFLIEKDERFHEKKVLGKETFIYNYSNLNSVQFSFKKKTFFIDGSHYERWQDYNDLGLVDSQFTEDMRIEPEEFAIEDSNDKIESELVEIEKFLRVEEI